MLSNNFRRFLIIACSSVMYAQTLAQQGTETTAQSHLDPSNGIGVDEDKSSGFPLDALIQKKLRKSSDAQIVLGKIAQERSQNPEIKMLAEQLIKDHQEMVKRLDQLTATSMSNLQPGQKQTSSLSSSGIETDTTGVGASGSATGGKGQGGQAASTAQPLQKQSDVVGSSSRGGSIAASGSAAGGKGQGGQAPGAPVSQGNTAYSNPKGSNSDSSGLRTAQLADLPGSTPSSEDRSPLNNLRSSDVRVSNDSNSPSQMLPLSYWQYIEQSFDEELAMTKSLLSAKVGSQFDLAYLTQQQVANIHSLAELKALESVGSIALRQTFSEAKDKLSDHLTHITQTLASLDEEASAKLERNR